MVTDTLDFKDGRPHQRNNLKTDSLVNRLLNLTISGTEKPELKTESAFWEGTNTSSTGGQILHFTDGGKPNCRPWPKILFLLTFHAAMQFFPVLS